MSNIVNKYYQNETLSVSSATAANGLIDLSTIDQDGGSISFSVQDYVYFP